MQGLDANHLPQEESERSEAEMIDQMKASDSDMIDPGLTSKNMELPSSVVMEQDKVDVPSERDNLCNPLAAAEAKYCLTKENRMDESQVFNGIWHLLVHFYGYYLSILLMNSFLLGPIKICEHYRNQIL